MPEGSSRDEFAVIAGAGGADPVHHQPIPAPPPPTRELPLGPPSADPVPIAPAMRAQADLEARLAELRQRFAPFRRRLEPPAPIARPRQLITAMDFRHESPDEGPGARPDDHLADAHAWSRVRIPHFTGPPGRWTGWYRERLDTDAAVRAAPRVWLRFQAADYRAHVTLNGRHLGSHVGLFAPFEFDVTRWLRKHDETNLLSVRIENEPPSLGMGSWGKIANTGELDGDKIYGATGLGWDEPGVGWHHCPPGAGLWQPVWLEGRPEVFLSDVFVRPIPDADEVELTLEVWQTPEQRSRVAALVEIIPSNFEGQTLGPLRVALDDTLPETNRYVARLRAPGLRRWDPETPYLYVARVTLLVAGAPDADPDQPIDSVDTRFGVRTFTMDTERDRADHNGHLAGSFHLNGEEIVLRGANTMGHMQRAIFEGDHERAADDMLIAKAANLNFYRLTQRPVQPEIYHLADELGFMLQTDFPLFGFIRRGAEAEVVRQAGEMERLVRNHPCSVLVTLINEPMPLKWKAWSLKRSIDRDELEEVLRASVNRILADNPDRVVKPCDGDYLDVAPPGSKPDHHCYAPWYTDHGLHLGRLLAGEVFPLRPGWRGGCGEYGAEGLDTLEVMINDYPESWRPAGPDDASWTPEPIVRNQTWPGSGKWFAPAETAAGWIAASQGFQAWGVRALTDAFRRRLDVLNSTALHLLIDAWPAGWMKSVMTVRREAKPAWFELAHAFSPLAVNLSCPRVAAAEGDVVPVQLWLLDERRAAHRREGEPLTLRWAAVVNGRETASGQQPVTTEPVASRALGLINLPIGRAAVDAGEIALRATLLDESGSPLHTHQIRLQAWPALGDSDADRALAGALVAIGPTRDPATRDSARALVERLGARCVPLDTTDDTQPAADADLLILDPASGTASQAALADAIQRGAKVYLLPQPAETGDADNDRPAIDLPGCPVGIKPFGGVYNALPSPDHRAARDAPADAAWLWWDHAAGRVDHTARSWLVAEGLAHILTFNSRDWGREPERFRVPVIAEKRFDTGAAVLLDQSRAIDVWRTEPRAARLLASALGVLIGREPADWPFRGSHQPAWIWRPLGV